MTVTPTAPTAQTAADLTPQQLELRERARRFVDTRGRHWLLEER
jgi:hypothetical protein